MFVNWRPKISPITAVENASIRSRQVYAKTSSAGSQQFFAVWFIVLVDCNDLAVVCGATALLGYGAESERAKPCNRV